LKQRHQFFVIRVQHNSVMNTKHKKTVWLAGGDGLVGRRFAETLDQNKYSLVVLTRKKKSAESEFLSYAQWDTSEHKIYHAPAPDIIINLAGAGIADQRWTSKRKKEIIDSRVNSARTIEAYLREQGHSPELYISASAVGYYGDQGSRLLTEADLPGTEFMSECCEAWEKAASETAQLCRRSVILRIGIVLTLKGGALPKMLMTRKAGIFNYFGNGAQYYPWIHIDDICKIMVSAIEDSTYEGVFNAVSPQEISNKDMMREIVKTNGFFGIFIPAPAFVLKIILGEMSKVVLNSNRVKPERLLANGFSFQFVKAGEAVKDLLNKGC
jgi:uncharacterized protein (TIGR01777 family)